MDFFRIFGFCVGLVLVSDILFFSVLVFVFLDISFHFFKAMFCGAFLSSTILLKKGQQLRKGHSPEEKIIGKIEKCIKLPRAGRVPHKQSDATQQECLQ